MAFASRAALQPSALNRHLSLVMGFPPVSWTLILVATLAAASVSAQRSVPPQTVVDLKALGAAPDLFSDQSDSKYAQRGALEVFWIGPERVAIAFSTNHRWSGNAKPEPLNIHLVVFDRLGKQLNERAWTFGAEGPASQSTLKITPGPDDTILAIHETAAADAANARAIPEGNFIQILKPDTSLQQNFYVPATSSAVPGESSDSRLVLQQFFADQHSSLTWWSGHPLKPGARLDIPRGSGQTLVGPDVAARPYCISERVCSGIRIFRADKHHWFFTNPTPGMIPVPRVFLNTNDLVTELDDLDSKTQSLLVARPDGTRTLLPEIPKGFQLMNVSGVSTNAQRLALDIGGEAGLCAGFSLLCRQRSQTLVVDIPSNTIVFQQELSVNGGQSALSPDGNRIAIFDRNKLAIYNVP